jgi:hypothetical protein
MLTSASTSAGLDARLLYTSIDVSAPVSLTSLRSEYQYLELITEHCIRLSYTRSEAGLVSAPRTHGPLTVNESTVRRLASHGLEAPEIAQELSLNIEEVQRALSIPGPLPTAESVHPWSSTHAIKIVRTSVASPWVTVLGSATESAMPLGYGLAALFSLERLLNMIKSWQTHRLTMKSRELELRMRQSEAQELAVRHAEYELRDQKDSYSVVPTFAARIMAQTANDSANAISGLSPIIDARLIDPNDPRATGAA